MKPAYDAVRQAIVTLGGDIKVAPKKKYVSFRQRKGDRVYVEGRIEYDAFERNGVTVPTAEIVIQELILIGLSLDSYGVADYEDSRE